jgi:hypothetical protein
VPPEAVAPPAAEFGDVKLQPEHQTPTIARSEISFQNFLVLIEHEIVRKAQTCHGNSSTAERAFSRLTRRLQDGNGFAFTLH